MKTRSLDLPSSILGSVSGSMNPPCQAPEPLRADLFDRGNSERFESSERVRVFSVDCTGLPRPPRRKEVLPAVSVAVQHGILKISQDTQVLACE